jgi:predicted enzyme related to lactoylglutathione lyase
MTPAYLLKPATAIAHRRRWLAGVSVLVAVLLVILACAQPMPTVPPLGTDDTRLPGKVVWHDLVTPEFEKTKAFYEGLLGWTFEDLSDGYSLASLNGRPVAGIAKLDLAGRVGHWLSLVSVTNIDAVHEQALAAGAASMKAPFELPGRGKVAVLKDPQGAAFGIVQSSQGDPNDRKADPNDWLWNEIWTDDVASAAQFYTSVLGYEVGEKTVSGVAYRFLKHGDTPRLGLLKKMAPELENTWVSFIRVEDVAGAVAKVESLGGQVLVAPQANIRNASLAILTDPSGAGFILQEWTK